MEIPSAIEIIIGVGIIALGFGYVTSQFLVGRKGRTKDDIETENTLTTYLKNQIEGFKEIVEKQNNRIAGAEKEISALRATLGEKDKIISRYLEILQNRNPEIDTFIKESKVRQEQQMGIMNEIKVFMKNINDHMVQQNKDLKIEATVSHKTP